MHLNMGIMERKSVKAPRMQFEHNLWNVSWDAWKMQFMTLSRLAVPMTVVAQSKT
jgi:hypothetical protein